MQSISDGINDSDDDDDDEDDDGTIDPDSQDGNGDGDVNERQGTHPPFAVEEEDKQYNQFEPEYTQQTEGQMSPLLTCMSNSNNITSSSGLTEVFDDMQMSSYPSPSPSLSSTSSSMHSGTISNTTRRAVLKQQKQNTTTVREPDTDKNKAFHVKKRKEMDERATVETPASQKRRSAANKMDEMQATMEKRDNNTTAFQNLILAQMQQDRVDGACRYSMHFVLTHLMSFERA